MLDVDGVLITGRPEDGRFWAHDLERDLGIHLDALRKHLFEPSWVDIVEGRRDLRLALSECLPRFAPGATADTLMRYWFEKDAGGLGRNLEPKGPDGTAGGSQSLPR